MFAGTAGSVPSARRGLPAFLVRRGAERILIDCGEGTQRQLLRSVGLSDLTDIFITHLHVDHWLGLPGLLQTFNLRDTGPPLSIYGPRGLAELDGVRCVSSTGAPASNCAWSSSSPRRRFERDGFRNPRVRAPPRRWRLRLCARRGRASGHFDAELARVARGHAGPGLRPPAARRDGQRRRAGSGDRAGRDRGARSSSPATRAPCETLAIAAYGADLLVHEATFGEDERDRARATGHSTAAQAARIAADADVKLLALTHISARYGGSELREEARAVFAATELPRDFDTIDIPLEDRGVPTLVRPGEG